MKDIWFEQLEQVAQELRDSYCDDDPELYEPWRSVGEDVRDRWRRVAAKALRLLQ